MVDWTLDYKDRNDSSGDLEYFDISKLQFSKYGDALRLTIEDDRSYLKVHAVRAFPLTEINNYIGLMDAITHKEIGLISSLQDLDSQTRQLVEDELNKRYFIPKICKIFKAKREFGTIYWEVDTDRGHRQFVVRGIRDSIHEIQPGRYLITDVDNNRFEIPQFDNLDMRSRGLWEKIL